MKEIYCTVNAESEHETLEDFGKKRDCKYLMISTSWQRNRNDLTKFFGYPDSISRVIYTKNSTDSTL